MCSHWKLPPEVPALGYRSGRKRRAENTVLEFSLQVIVFDFSSQAVCKEAAFFPLSELYLEGFKYLLKKRWLHSVFI